MARPRTRSDAQVLEAARAVLLQRGPHAPLSAIARRLGLTPSAIVARFGTKQALTQAALRPPALPSAVLAQLYAEPLPGELAPQLHQLCLRLATWYATAVPLRLAARYAPQPVPRLSGDDPCSQVRLHNALAIWLARAQARGQLRPGDSHAMARILLSSLEGRAAHQLMERCEPRPELAVFVAQLVALLLPPPP